MEIPMKKFLFTLFFILFSFTAIQAQELLKVYYLRHAEGGHNVVDEWKDKPKDQWPAYVGNPDIFTPKGNKQVELLTEKLKGMHFDFIAVSPIWRSRNTVLPYLKAANLKGEIWPELAETSYIHAETFADLSKLPPPSKELFAGNADIKLPESEAPYFTFREDGKRLINTYWDNRPLQNANNIAMSEKVIAMVKARYSKSGKSLLLVGHSYAGATLLRLLTGQKDLDFVIENTALWMAEEQPDGTFVLKMLNNKPFESPKN